MISLLYGDDTFSSHEALRQLYQAVGPPEMWESNITQMEGADFDVARFAAATQTVPFLAERRMAVVHGLLSTVEGREPARRGAGRAAGRGPDLGPAAGLKEALQALPPTTDVVLVDGRLSPNNPLLRELTPLAQVTHFPTLRGDALSQWVRQRVGQKGGTIAPPAMRALVDLVGGNLWAMDSELEKLTIYCGGRAVDVDDVHLLVPWAREANIFAAVDAILEGRADTAMGLISRLMKGGAATTYVLAMVTRQVRLLALAQALAGQKVPHDQWPERLGIQQEFVLRKTTEQARRYSIGQIRQLYHLLLDTDLAIKSGEASDELAMAEFLAQATGLGAGPARRPPSFRTTAR